MTTLKQQRELYLGAVESVIRHLAATEQRFRDDNQHANLPRTLLKLSDLAIGVNEIAALGRKYKVAMMV
jgi:hypothetical protein